jgi:hypothetical protein
LVCQLGDRVCVELPNFGVVVGGLVARACWHAVCSTASKMFSCSSFPSRAAVVFGLVLGVCFVLCPAVARATTIDVAEAYKGTDTPSLPR